jgi:hypothetical protein
VNDCREKDLLERRMGGITKKRYGMLDSCTMSGGGNNVTISVYI